MKWWTGIFFWSGSLKKNQFGEELFKYSDVESGDNAIFLVEDKEMGYTTAVVVVMTWHDD